MNKFIYILISLLFCVGKSFAQEDSLHIGKLNTAIHEQSEIISQIQTQNEKLEKRTQELEDSKKTAYFWLGVLAFLFTGSSAYTVYLRFWGLKKMAEEAIDKVAEPVLKKLAPEVLNKVLEENTFYKHQQSLAKVKEKPILIVSPKGKNSDFDAFLEGKGFSNIKSYKLHDLSLIDPNDFKLLLFNNHGGDMKQNKMDSVIAHFGNNIHYFYFQGKGTRWENPQIKMAGFSNTLERLENNLIDALNK